MDHVYSFEYQALHTLTGRAPTVGVACFRGPKKEPLNSEEVTEIIDAVRIRFPPPENLDPVEKNNFLLNQEKNMRTAIINKLSNAFGDYKKQNPHLFSPKLRKEYPEGE